MDKIHIWPEEHRLSGNQIEVNVVIEGAGADRKQLWYRMPREYQNALTTSCNPYVLAALFNAMRAPADLIVHGQVSPSLLRNLEEFQAAWIAWRPEYYSKIQILADDEREIPGCKKSAGVTAFSGGVDSAFTVYRHRTDLSRWSRRDLQAGLMLKWMNLGLDKDDEFNRAVNQGRVMLDSLQMELIPMVTNFQTVCESWLDSYVLLLASGLSLLAGGYSYGLIPSQYSYTGLKFPSMINPVTDPFLSSDTFRIIEDGPAYLRFEKIRTIAGWPEATQNLMVCFNPGGNNLNCSRCEKCIRTILGFRAWGFGLPPCFEQDANVGQILRLKFAPTLQIEQYIEIVKTAQMGGKISPWVLALKMAIIKNRLYRKARQFNSLRRLRQVFRRP